MTATYDCIATTTLSTATATITFSTISGSFTDLVVVFNGGMNTAADNLYIRFNSDTGNNYSSTRLHGNGTSAVSDRQSNSDRMNIDQSGYMSTDLTCVEIFHVMNYANTTTYKTVVIRASEASSGTAAGVGLWRNTNAITSITLGGTGGGNLKAGSIATLYGIKAE